jgi:uncharacterized protein YjaG (DUF416 family)
MTPISFHQQALRDRLDRLDPRRRAEFALGCAERLFPYYERFHDQTGQGDPSVGAGALSLARAQLESGEASAAEFGSLADRCQALVPMEDDSWTDLSGLAQNAPAGAFCALRSRVSGAAEEARWGAVQGFEASDLVATTTLDVDFNQPGVEDLIAAEDVVQRELIAQEESMRSLEQTRID